MPSSQDAILDLALYKFGIIFIYYLFKESICATYGPMANGQVSCPNIAFLKMGPYLRNRCPWSENKFNFDPLGEKDTTCATSGTLAKAKFHAQIWQF